MPGGPCAASALAPDTRQKITRPSRSAFICSPGTFVLILARPNIAPARGLGEILRGRRAGPMRQVMAERGHGGGVAGWIIQRSQMPGTRQLHVLRTGYHGLQCAPGRAPRRAV